MTEYETINCMACGKPTPANLIDAKPGPGNWPVGPDALPWPDSAEYTQLECQYCYGPGWCEL